jgi:hypothetical protein
MVTEIFMASYYIIGGDTKEYGPITADDLRLWIAEGRLSAQSLAKGEGDTAWRTLGSFPEFTDALNLPPPTIAPLVSAPGFSPVSASGDFLERDYELDIGGCVTRGWELMKGNFGTLFLSFLLAIVIVGGASAAINGLGSLALAGWLAHSPVLHQVFRLFCGAVTAPVTGPVMAGLYFLFIRASRGEAVNVGEVFTGFQRSFKDLFIGYLIVSLLIGVCMTPYTFVSDAKLLPITEQMQHASPADLQNLMPQFWAAIFATLPVLFICMIPVTYLSVNLQFTLPLIIDQQMAFWPAMKASWKMVHKHWWQVFGLTIVVGLVSAAGIFGCCIGVLFTIPIGMAAMMIAYETIFCARKI